MSLTTISSIKKVTEAALHCGIQRVHEFGGIFDKFIGRSFVDGVKREDWFAYVWCRIDALMVQQSFEKVDGDIQVLV